MILTFGPSKSGEFTGAAYEGIAVLPKAANYLNWLLEPLFGFTDPHQVAFPITALGAVGAALSLVPNFLSHGWIDGNAIAVFTGMGMCWSGFLSTHTAMLDTIGYRELTSQKKSHSFAHHRRFCSSISSTLGLFAIHYALVNVNAISKTIKR